MSLQGLSTAQSTPVCAAKRSGQASDYLSSSSPLLHACRFASNTRSGSRGWSAGCLTARRQHPFCRFSHTSRSCPPPQRRSSCRAAASMTSNGSASSHDLLIVGPGVLGSYVGQLWRQQFPGAEVVGQTNTPASHDRLRALGITPRTKDQAAAADRKFPFVLFSAPPSGSSDYPAEARAVREYWDGSGTLLFTSSAGLYAIEDGSQCNEDSRIVESGISERNDRLIGAEQAILEVGGCVVRLVGLYHAHRGAHTFFIRMGQVPRWAGYTVNLIHYEDAATLSAAILQGNGRSEGGYYRGRVFVGTDGSPLTFQEMIDAVTASGAFEGSGGVAFTGEAGGNRGKLVCNRATRQALRWTPKYASFEAFMQAGARDVYCAGVLSEMGAAHAPAAPPKQPAAA